LDIGILSKKAEVKQIGRNGVPANGGPAFEQDIPRQSRLLRK